MNEIESPIIWKLHLPVSPAVVFETLDSDDGRASFWAESTTEQDGIITFRFANGVVHEARILDRRTPDLFELEYFGGVARFELISDGAGGTDLTLTHDVPEEEWLETWTGWLNVLFPLKAWLVAGVDIRNHDPERTWDEGYADG